MNTEFAWNVDEPGHTLQMPQILSKAGIKNFIIWKVLIRDKNHLNVTGYVGPAIFRWQSPDGSKVLVAHCPDGYSSGSRLRTNDFKIAEQVLMDFKNRQVARHNDFNLPPVILMAEGGDCSIPDPLLGINAMRWDAKYGTPSVKLATANEYFKSVEDAALSGKGKIQIITGEMPAWWDGTQSVENDAFKEYQMQRQGNSAGSI